MVDNEVYFTFLDDIRKSGLINMFGATPYLMEMWPGLNKRQARKILAKWMNTYEERHSENRE